MKTTQVIVKMTDEQKDFLLSQASEERRTITTIINTALSEKYPKYKEILEKGGKGNGNQQSN